MMSSLNDARPNSYVSISSSERYIGLLCPCPDAHSSPGISEVLKLENNENLRLTLEALQMPTVEYKEINMDDYSRQQKNQKGAFSSWLHPLSRFLLFSAPALSVQILKPAAFTGTSHYPLLLLVYVGTYEDARTHARTAPCIYQFCCTCVQRWDPWWSGGDGAVPHGLGHSAGEQLRRGGGALRRAGQRLPGDQPAASHPEEAGRV